MAVSCESIGEEEENVIAFGLFVVGEAAGDGEVYFGGGE